MLEIFWQSHSPTYSSSRQYMSAIWYHDKAQKNAAESSKVAQSEKRHAKIYTEIRPLGDWTNAEDYHQKYYLRHQPDIIDKCGLDSEDAIRDSPLATKLNGFVHRGSSKHIEEFKKELENFDEVKDNKELAQYIQKWLQNKSSNNSSRMSCLG